MAIETHTDPTPVELSNNLEETLRRGSAVVALFLSRRMLCPGCPMARFETLADAARNYRVDGEELLAAVRGAVAGEDSGALSGRPGGAGAPTRPGGADEGAGGESGGQRAPQVRGRQETR